MSVPKGKAPAYQWYPKDWSSDEAVKTMTLEQRGIYRELLDHQWLEGSIPGDVAHLAAMFRIPIARFRRLWVPIAAKFQAVDNGRLVNLRLERQRAEQDEYFSGKRAAGQKGGLARAARLAEAKQGASTKVALLDSATSESLAESKPSSASASADQEPPVPPASRGAARVSTGPATRREREWALEVLRDYRKSVDYRHQCPHDPDCGDESRCIGLLVQDQRLAEATGQTLALGGTVGYKKQAVAS